jgi:hypothetical protein
MEAGGRIYVVVKPGKKEERILEEGSKGERRIEVGERVAKESEIEQEVVGREGGIEPMQEMRQVERDWKIRSWGNHTGKEVAWAGQARKAVKNPCGKGIG